MTGPKIEHLPRPLASRVRVGSETDCWEWMGQRTTGGYGVLSVKGRMHMTHRLVYEVLVGPIPVGLQIDHLCRNRACCRPDHLEPVTAKVNSERGMRAQAEECKYGHPFSGDNLGFRKQSRYPHLVARVCLTCQRDRGRRGQEKRRQAQQAA